MKTLYVEDTEDYTKTVQRMAKHLQQFSHTLILVEQRYIAINGQYESIIMKSALGHQVILAANGTEGYARAQEHPDLILLDINLPDINGLSLARQLRAANITVPIIYCHYCRPDELL